MHEPNQDALGSGHQCVRDSLPFQIFRHLANTEIRPEGHWCRVHYFLNWSREIAPECVSTDDAEHHAIWIKDDHWLAAIGPHAIAYVADPLIEPTRLNVTLRDIRYSRGVSLSSLTR
jgi:hypothetical protein